MKIIRISLFLILILTMTLVATSCGAARNAAERIDNVEDSIEDKIEDQYEKKSADFALSEADAQRIALEHAEVALDSAQYLRVKADRDDGVPVYEVNFHVAAENGKGYVEYEYTIHATTGKVLEFDNDFESVR